MGKDPFDYRRFKCILRYDTETLDNSDAMILGRRVCRNLTEVTKMVWLVESCVGGKCNLITRIIGNRNIRKKWMRKTIEIDNVPHLSI